MDNPGYRELEDLDSQETRGKYSWDVGFYNADVLPTVWECSQDFLDVGISYGTGSSEISIEDAYATLVGCPNIWSLTVDVEQGGCSIGGPFSFPFRQNDRFPALETLKVSAYNWKEETPYEWEPGLRPPSTIAWKEAMDWSKLKHLDLALPPIAFFGNTTGDQLKNLESLVLRPLNGFWGDVESLCTHKKGAEDLRRAVFSFVASTPPLKALTINGLGRVPSPSELEQLLSIHGQSLRHLSLHDFEGDCNYDRTYFNVSQIDQIRRGTVSRISGSGYQSNYQWNIPHRSTDGFIKDRNPRAPYSPL